MRLTPFSLALTVAVALGLSACTGSTVTPVSVPSSVPVTPVAAQPSVAPSPQATLSGEARYFGTPFADAEVFAGPVGQALVAVGKTDGQGHFTFVAPAGGTLVVAVRKGAQHAATLVEQAPRTVAAVGGPIVVDELSAFVYLTFMPRFVAIDGLSKTSGADVTLTGESLAIFEEAVAALRALQKPVGREAYEAVSAALEGEVVNPDGTTRQSLIAATPPDFVDALVACGDKLNNLIRTQVLEKGQPMPPPSLLEPIQLRPNGSAVSPQVFQDNSQNNSGQGGGGQGGGDTSEPTIGVGNVQLDPATDPFVDETATPTITLENQVP